MNAFERDPDGSVRGYNKQVRGASLRTPWTAVRRRDGRVAWAPFLVLPGPDGTAGLLLDYGAVAHPEPGVAHRLRDALVRVDPGSDDVLLGRAYVALGSRRPPVGWVVLEHLGPAEPDRC